MWLLCVWGLAQGSYGVISAKMASISPRPRVAVGVRELDGWLKTQFPAETIVLGPNLGKYSPWMTRFYDWYDLSRVKVMKVGDPTGKFVLESKTGYLVDEEWSPLALQLDKEPEIGGLKLSKVASAGGFVVYAWPESPFTIQPKSANGDH